LIIKGPLRDLRDVLKIAIVEGRKVLKVKDVNVKPIIYPYGNASYLVLVEPNGCDGASVVGGGKKQKIKRENTPKN